MVVSGNMTKVVSLYDNEWGYSNRVIDLTQGGDQKGTKRGLVTMFKKLWNDPVWSKVIAALVFWVIHYFLLRFLH